MRQPECNEIPKNIRPTSKKTRFWVDNEILEVYGPKLKPSGIALYCGLARHANSKTQMCFPSYPRLMEITGIGKRNTISKYLKIIENLGLIIINRNKRREPNRYWMINPKTDSAQIDTIKKEYVYTQKEKIQYTNSKLHSTERDTLNQRTNSNKEREEFPIKEEEIKKISITNYTPDYIKKLRGEL
jgi:hypothetical protein